MESFVITTEDVCASVFTSARDYSIEKQIQHCETHVPWDRPEYNPWGRDNDIARQIQSGSHGPPWAKR